MSIRLYEQYSSSQYSHLLTRKETDEASDDRWQAGIFKLEQHLHSATSIAFSDSAFIERKRRSNCIVIFVIYDNLCQGSNWNREALTSLADKLVTSDSSRQAVFVLTAISWLHPPEQLIDHCVSSATTPLPGPPFRAELLTVWRASLMLTSNYKSI